MNPVVAIRRQPSVFMHLVGLVALTIFGSAVLVWVAGEMQRGRPPEERVLSWRTEMATLETLAPTELSRRNVQYRLDPPPQGRPLPPRMARALGRSPREVVLSRGTVWAKQRGANPGWVALDHDPRWGPSPVWRWATWLTAGGLSLLGAAWVARRLVGPLATLERAAPALIAGAPSRLPTAAPREIASLALALESAHQDARKAAKERTVMLAGISHDLRTPLARMRFALELLEADADPELKAGLDRDIEEIDAIVGQFIDYARDGRDEPEVVLNVADLLREVVAAEDLAGVWSLETPDSAWVEGRPLALRRALTNLVHNALVHGEAPWSASLSPVGDFWEVAVVNGGKGLTADEQAAALQPFVRGTQSGGSGLGLAIVQRVAEQHQGHFLVSSAPGQGFSAVLRLPMLPP